MTDWVPYLGPAVVIVVSTIALVVLARHGVLVKKVKHRKTELEFESLSQPHTLGKPADSPPVALSKTMIQLTDAAESDCRKLTISPEEPVEFVLGEATRHPMLFAAEFASTPLVFGRNVLILSWEASEAKIERVLNREEAYPLNDAWNSCLALYRQTTLLPYRTRGPEQLKVSTEAKRVLAVYRRLVSKVEDFLRVLRESNEELPDAYQGMGSLLEEAEFSLANEDIGTSVSRLEVVLSTVHKLMLNCAPQGRLSAKTIAENEPEEKVPIEGGPTILCVDDDGDLVSALSDVLRRKDYVVATALSTREGLRAMVEHEFDLVITDLLMGPRMGEDRISDGREVVLAAKKSSDRTKVMVFSCYAEMSRRAELVEAGADAVVLKPCGPDEILAEVERLLGGPGVGKR